MPTNDHTPRGHAARYLPECYEGMRDDKDRTEAYRRAIAAAASGHIVLDIGTGALALLALFAAEAGAKHVYALEVQEAAYEAAKATVAASPFADKVTVIRAFSTDSALTLPAAPTLLVHELIGEVAGEEGVVAAITDARKRHLSPSATPPLSIPSRSRSLVAPCEFPDAAYCESLPSCLLDVPGQSRALKLLALPMSARLSASQTFEDLRFESASPEALQSSELVFVASRDGMLRGLAIEVELFCRADGGDDKPDVSSAWAGSHWRNVLLLLDGETPLTTGQRIKVATNCDLAGARPTYTFETWVEEEGNSSWRSLGPPICYPEAALNVNDAMDCLMEQMEG